MKHYYKAHYNDASLNSKESAEVRKSKKVSF